MRAWWQGLGRLIDRLPMVWVVVAAAWMAVTPIVPEPHLTEKLALLARGELTRPLDVFDLLWHAAPLWVLAVKLWRLRQRGGMPPPSP